MPTPYEQVQDIEFDLYNYRKLKGRLYHYTSLTALGNILESRRLYASDIRYLNDASELTHTTDLMVAAGRQKGVMTVFESQAALFLEVGRDLYSTYVGCFTEEPNLLSQWRGYCPPGQGVSIGFNAKALSEAAERQGFSLGKVLYGQREKEAIVKKVVEALRFDRPVTASGESAAEAIEGMLPDNTLHLVLRIAALLKSPAFQEEAEWRVVLRNGGRPDITKCFRPGKTMMIPYVTFDLPARSNGALAIEEVWLGPTSHPELAEESLGGFLAAYDIDAPVRYCDIPLRVP